MCMAINHISPFESESLTFLLDIILVQNASDRKLAFRDNKANAWSRFWLNEVGQAEQQTTRQVKP